MNKRATLFVHSDCNIETLIISYLIYRKMSNPLYEVHLSAKISVSIWSDP